jgi:hypothetical protein
MNIRALLSATALAALVACGGDTLESTPQATLVGRYAHNVGAGVSEIVAFHAESQSIFITVDSANTPVSFQRLSLRNLRSTALANPTTASNLESGAITSVSAHVNDSGFTAGGVQTLAISGNLLAIAVQATPKTANGVVAFYRLDAQGNTTYIKKVTVGSLPDGMAFTPDGSKLVVANEGTPNTYPSLTDPTGGVSIIRMSDRTVTNVGLGGSIPTTGSGLRGVVPFNYEPEYIAVNQAGTKAWVTLQEHNAIATLDLTTSEACP